MTENTIQRARDVLAKLREAATSGGDTPWTTSYDPTAYPYSAFVGGYEVIEAPTPGIARLIVGTAGNPDLLDAIDGMLALASDGGPVPATVLWFANHAAAAIIAADERMNA